MSMDLDEILQVFFEETDDHLNTLETLLSELRPSNVSDATVNAILRAAHSIKGNSATCGLSQVSKVAHEMESLLDVVRQRQGALNTSAVRLLLEVKRPTQECFLSSWLWKLQMQTSDRASTKRSATGGLKTTALLLNMVEGRRTGRCALQGPYGLAAGKTAHCF